MPGQRESESEQNIGMSRECGSKESENPLDLLGVTGHAPEMVSLHLSNDMENLEEKLPSTLTGISNAGSECIALGLGSGAGANAGSSSIPIWGASDSQHALDYGPPLHEGDVAMGCIVTEKSGPGMRNPNDFDQVGKLHLFGSGNLEVVKGKGKAAMFEAIAGVASTSLKAEKVGLTTGNLVPFAESSSRAMPANYLGIEEGEIATGICTAFDSGVLSVDKNHTSLLDCLKIARPALDELNCRKGRPAKSGEESCPKDEIPIAASGQSEQRDTAHDQDAFVVTNRRTCGDIFSMELDDARRDMIATAADRHTVFDGGRVFHLWPSANEIRPFRQMQNMSVSLEARGNSVHALNIGAVSKPESLPLESAETDSGINPPGTSISHSDERNSQLEGVMHASAHEYAFGNPSNQPNKSLFLISECVKSTSAELPLLIKADTNKESEQPGSAACPRSSMSYSGNYRLAKHNVGNKSEEELQEKGMIGICNVLDQQVTDQLTCRFHGPDAVKTGLNGADTKLAPEQFQKSLVSGLLDKGYDYVEPGNFTQVDDKVYEAKLKKNEDDNHCAEVFVKGVCDKENDSEKGEGRRQNTAKICEDEREKCSENPEDERGSCSENGESKRETAERICRGKREWILGGRSYDMGRAKLLKLNSESGCETIFLRSGSGNFMKSTSSELALIIKVDTNKELEQPESPVCPGSSMSYSGNCRLAELDIGKRSEEESQKRPITNIHNVLDKQMTDELMCRFNGLGTVQTSPNEDDTRLASDQYQKNLVSGLVDKDCDYVEPGNFAQIDDGVCEAKVQKNEDNSAEGSVKDICDQEKGPEKGEGKREDGAKICKSEREKCSENEEDETGNGSENGESKRESAESICGGKREWISEEQSYDMGRAKLLKINGGSGCGTSFLRSGSGNFMNLFLNLQKGISQKQPFAVSLPVPLAICPQDIPGSTASDKDLLKPKIWHSAECSKERAKSSNFGLWKDKGFSSTSFKRHETGFFNQTRHPCQTSSTKTDRGLQCFPERSLPHIVSSAQSKIDFHGNVSSLVNLLKSTCNQEIGSACSFCTPSKQHGKEFLSEDPPVPACTNIHLNHSQQNASAPLPQAKNGGPQGDLMNNMWVAHFTSKHSLPLQGWMQNKLNVHLQQHVPCERINCEHIEQNYLQEITKRRLISNDLEKDTQPLDNISINDVHAEGKKHTVHTASMVGSRHFTPDNFLHLPYHSNSLQNGSDCARGDDAGNFPNEQGPADVSTAMASLKAWRFEAAKFKGPSMQTMPLNMTEAKANSMGICIFCGLAGHPFSECSETLDCELGDLEKKVPIWEKKREKEGSPVCIRCLQSGHWAIQCHLSASMASSHASKQVASTATNKGLLTVECDDRRAFMSFKAGNRIISEASKDNSLCDQTGVHTNYHLTFGRQRFGYLQYTDASDSSITKKLRQENENACAEMNKAMECHETDQYLKETGYCDQVATEGNEMGKSVKVKQFGWMSQENEWKGPGGFLTTSIPCKDPFCIFSGTAMIVPKDMLASIEMIRLSRTDILKWVQSPDLSSRVEGFFLRLRFGKWEEELGGTGYRMARITDATRIAEFGNKAISLSVDLGDLKCAVDCRYVSNQVFAEAELIEWWRSTFLSGQQLPSKDEVKVKLEEKQRWPSVNSL